MRITVEIEPTDRNLQVWLTWARDHLEPEWLARLHPVATGNLRQAKTWRLYFGIIPADSFMAVDRMEAAASHAGAAPAALRTAGA